MATLHQRLTNFEMIEYLAVEDDGIAPVTCHHGLVSPGYVKDAQTLHAEAEITINQEATIVRAPMPNRLGLGRDSRPFYRSSSAPVPACNSAHSMPTESRFESTGSIVGWRMPWCGANEAWGP